jgi:hypothetical protein
MEDVRRSGPDPETGLALDATLPMLLAEEAGRNGLIFELFLFLRTMSIL